ncbi:MAG TPA: Lrp/AsnC family transcriptional regulator [Steroidobacteraceae bacterium]|jgi:DNA-binding Lrp family transcriptional regulator
MNDLTAQMIAILRRNGRASYSEIARELGTNRDYVASRINPLIESGKLSIVASVHPRVLGLTTSAHLSIKASGNIQSVIDALEKFDAPVLISVVAGAFQIVVELQLRSLTELNREVLAIRAIKGVREVYVHLYERILSSFFLGTGPESLSQFDEVDINIVNRLLHDGRASFAEIAQVVGLSVSGCRTRVQRLLESGVIQIGAIKQRADMTNDLVFGIGVNAQDDCREAIDAIAANRGLEFIARTVGRFDLLATVEFDSLRDFNLLVSRLRSLPSVEYCEQWLHVRIVRERYWRTLAQPNHR